MTLSVDQAKILAILLLGGGSFFVGMLPGYLNRRFQERHQLTITFLLCFGAGVLLATSLVHILSEVQESLPEAAAVYFCIGFFLVYLVDVAVHYFFGEAPGHSHGGGENARPNYGAVESERESLLAPTTAPSEQVPLEAGETANAQVPNVQCPNSNATGKFGLLCALSLHSFLEGLAIGVQDTSAKVMILITAVSCHKFVVGFCLGLEVSSGNSARGSMRRNLFVSMMIFAFGSIFGIALGMALVDYKDLWTSSTIPILQAIAGGTLLYVTLCEVMPREKAKYHQRSKPAIVLQFVACVSGFTVMTLINFYLSK